MALHFPLMVNGRDIGQFVAVRREYEIPPDGMCTYDVEIDDKEIVIRHKYHAGAWALVAKAIEELEKRDQRPIRPAP